MIVKIAGVNYGRNLQYRYPLSGVQCSAYITGVSGLYDTDPIRMQGNDVNIFVTVMKLRGTIM